MAMTEKIKILLVKKKISAAQLAKLLGTTSANLYNKFKRDNFSEKELIEIANVLSCEYEAGFVIKETGERV